MTPPGQAATAEKLAPAHNTFERWYQEHHQRLRAWCISLVGDYAIAEDIAQEALARAWVSRDRLASRSEVGPWLWRVARNLCVDHLRSRRRLVSVQSLAEEPSDASDPSGSIEAEEERRAVRRALASLSPRHRELLYLHHVDGVGYDELALRTGLSNQGARSVLFRARQGLRERLRTLSEGAMGGLVWMRVKARGAARRVADAVNGLPEAAGPLVQGGLALALASGMALAGLGAAAAASDDFARSAGSAGRVEPAAGPPAATDAPGAARAREGQSATRRSGGGDGPQGPDVDGRVDPEQGSFGAHAYVPPNPATNDEIDQTILVWIEDPEGHPVTDAAVAAGRAACSGAREQCDSLKE